ncbi:probable prolyl 4-hydroxylase 9 [Phtheirospermum japonicum]|uniref:Probable prolyl 4-hydroxylase 9 n=1 Tax=Phtheirospermum japonicum TaxID=374723 RepID=A0A830BUJ3_9LAMI|nr:probable prolyl 4-hydroxylase 9 [Phtheirospermum japonicum]
MEGVVSQYLLMAYETHLICRIDKPKNVDEFRRLFGVSMNECKDVLEGIDMQALYRIEIFPQCEFLVGSTTVQYMGALGKCFDTWDNHLLTENRLDIIVNPHWECDPNYMKRTRVGNNTLARSLWYPIISHWRVGDGELEMSQVMPLVSQDVNRGVSRHKVVEDFQHEEDDLMFHGESGEPFINSIPFQILSWRPRALYFPNFATDEQCQSVIQMAKRKLKPSSLALRKGESAESTKGAFNVLRYEVGQRYISHYDSFDPAVYGPQKSQRIASFLLYLSDVEEGGETMFPFENGSNMNIGYNYKSCIGLKVRPRRGDGLLFYSEFPNRTLDKTSLHGSCPVVKGEKWVATKWIRDKERM